MKTKKNGEGFDSRDKKFPISRALNILEEVYPISGQRVLDRILKEENAQELIHSLAHGDFFWLVKKVGDNDCLALLEMASEDQLQYLLDMELWIKDRLDLTQAFQWLERLKQADPDKLARWLFGEGQAFTYFYFFKNIQVVIREEDEILEPAEGFVTFDGVFYFRVIDKRQRETMEGILRAMAAFDLEHYRAVLQGLAGVLPAEMEEEMYRMRNIRLAEHGFLPFDEAIAIYTPLDAMAITAEESGEKFHIFTDEIERSVVPLSPLYYAGGSNLLTEAFSRIHDSLFLDRIRLEFAGLCNQILSADGILADDLEVLIKTCRKAAATLNLTLEKLCGKDLSSAERLLRKHSLVSVFRVGFGLALKLKWEAEAWLRESWFYSGGLEFDFWGEDWGRTLAGLLKDKPRFYGGLKEGEGYKEFEKLEELDACGGLINRLKVLDRLLARLAGLYPLDKGVFQTPGLTFQQLLFNLWARQLLRLEPCFSGISPAQAREFFGHIRGGRELPPYRISAFKQKFISYFISLDPSLEVEDEDTLKKTLSLIWEDFGEEYQRVSTDDLDRRFTKFIQITS